MKQKLAIMCILFPIVCLITSCTEEMKKTDFEKSINKHATETINNVWYIGSAKGFDYFVHNTATQSRKIRLKTGEITLCTYFPLTDDNKRWKLIKSDAEPLLRKNPISSLDDFPAFKIDSSLNESIER